MKVLQLLTLTVLIQLTSQSWGDVMDTLNKLTEPINKIAQNRQQRRNNKRSRSNRKDKEDLKNLEDKLNLNSKEKVGRRARELNKGKDHFKNTMDNLDKIERGDGEKKGR